MLNSLLGILNTRDFISSKFIGGTEDPTFMRVSHLRFTSAKILDPPVFANTQPNQENHISVSGSCRFLSFDRLTRVSGSDADDNGVG